MMLVAEAGAASISLSAIRIGRGVAPIRSAAREGQRDLFHISQALDSALQA